MITDRERRNIETIYESEMDFYAPLLFLALSRYNANPRRIENGEASISVEELQKLVIGCYKDLKESGL